MPGMAEISATLAALRTLRSPERLALIPLHGDLPPEQQDAAFAPSSLRKVVVATNVAETSVTIDGIRHVVDSGLARIARYDAERSINTLFIEPISRASAEQRKGRAGRTAPGTCLRLWTSGQLNRPERNTPEIRRSDIAEVVLLLEFPWASSTPPRLIGWTNPTHPPWNGRSNYCLRWEHCGTAPAGHAASSGAAGQSTDWTADAQAANAPTLLAHAGRGRPGSIACRPQLCAPPWSVGAIC